MKVKEYLSQIEILDARLKNKQRQLKEIKEMSTSIGSQPTDSEYVQSSTTGDRTGNAAARIYDLEQEIEREIVSYLGNKGKIIAEINSLQAGSNTKLYISILQQKYMWGDRLEQIAVDTGYTYDHIRHAHGYALLAFANQYGLDIK